MLFTKIEKTNKSSKTTVFANREFATWSKFKDKTLAQVDAIEPLVDAKRAVVRLADDTEFTCLMLEYKEKKVLFPLSRSFNEDLFNEPEKLIDCQFYTSRKMINETDEPGKPTGDPYISFGMVSEPNVIEEHSLIEAEATVPA